VHRRIVGEDRSSAVTVVEVEVDYQDRTLEPPGSLLEDRDRDVIEDAEALTVVGKRVMEPSSEVEGDGSARRGQPRGEQRAADGDPLKVDVGVALVLDGLEVGIGVNPPDHGEECRCRRMHGARGREPFRRQKGQDPCPTPGIVLGHGQLGLVGRVIDERMASRR